MWVFGFAASLIEEQIVLSVGSKCSQHGRSALPLRSSKNKLLP
jgi:hypothetical protein